MSERPPVVLPESLELHLDRADPMIDGDGWSERWVVGKPGWDDGAGTLGRTLGRCSVRERRECG